MINSDILLRKIDLQETTKMDGIAWLSTGLKVFGCRVILFIKSRKLKATIMIIQMIDFLSFKKNINDRHRLNFKRKSSIYLNFWKEIKLKETLNKNKKLKINCRRVILMEN